MSDDVPSVIPGDAWWRPRPEAVDAVVALVRDLTGGGPAAWTWRSA
ncbi:hypothetical protein ACWERV_27425 [Streptomyces sp. NPDC004031]